MSPCNLSKNADLVFFFFCPNKHTHNENNSFVLWGKVLWLVFIITINYINEIIITILKEKFAHNFTTSANQNVFIPLTL